MSIPDNANIKAKFVVRFKVDGVTVTADDLALPSMADQILPVLAGTDPVDFIDGILRLANEPDNFFYQPGHIDVVVNRNINAFLRGTIAPYLLSNPNFGWTLIEKTWSVLEDEPEWPDVLSDR